LVFRVAIKIYGDTADSPANDARFQRNFDMDLNLLTARAPRSLRAFEPGPESAARTSARSPSRVLDPTALSRARPLSQRSFHAPKDYCLRVPTAHQRLPPAGGFGAWSCNQIRKPPRKQDRPGSPGLGLQYVATKIGGGKTSPRVALTMVESYCSGPLQ
jgi:hypothetical protein